MKTKKIYYCTYKNCDNPYYAKGLCKRHYDQKRKSGVLSDVFKGDKNNYKIENDYVAINLYDKKNMFKGTTIIDIEDLERVLKYKWHLLNTGYVATTLYKENKKEMLLLHRYVIDAQKDYVVDHINHDTSDNRKHNLRICSQKENALNRKTKPKGITKIQRNDNTYYVVQLMGKYRGCFKELEEAEKSRDKIIQENYL